MPRPESIKCPKKYVKSFLRKQCYNVHTYYIIIQNKIKNMDNPINIPAQNNDFIKKWSWSAFLGTWVFCFANKQYKLGTKFLLFFLVLNFLLYAPWLGITNFSTIGSAGDTL